MGPFESHFRGGRSLRREKLWPNFVGRECPLTGNCAAILSRQLQIKPFKLGSVCITVQPNQRPPSNPLRDVRLGAGLYVCGDHRDTATVRARL